MPQLQLQRVLLTAVFFLCVAVPARSQTPLTLDGCVRDTTGRVVPYCTVSILQQHDSLVMGGAVSDTTGRYRLEFRKPGHYLVRYNHLAYYSRTAEVEIPAQTTLDMVLEPAVQNVDKIVVIAQYTKYSAGKTTVSMIGNPIAENRSVTEALELIPGITVRNGTISIHNTPVAIIYVNDRKATAAELSALLADNVDNIEIQNKAGSAYDATTEGGVLRIRLRKLSSGSFYGNVGTKYTMSPYLQMYNISVPLSLQFGKLNIYNYVAGQYSDGKTDLRDYAEYRKEGYLLNARTRGKTHLNRVSDNLSLVYEFNPHHVLGVYGGFEWAQSDPRNTQLTSLDPMEGFKNPQIPDARYTDYHYGGTIYNRLYQGVVSYKYTIDTLGSDFQLKADYASQRVGKQYDYTTLQYPQATDPTPLATEQRHEAYTPFTSALELRSDLTKIFSDRRSLQAGLTYDYEQIDNNSVITRLTEGQWQVDENQSVWFLNRTQSGAAYAAFSDAYGGFSYQAGLRFQWDRIAYKGAPQDAMTHRDYWRWFPEMSLAYTFNKEKNTLLNLDLSRYSSSIPSGTDILPKRTWVSDYNYTTGNPLLKPYQGIDLGLTYTLRGRWAFRYRFISSNDETNTFTFYDPDDPTVVFTMPMNAGTSYGHYASVSADTPVTKWMRVSAQVLGRYQRNFYALGEQRYSSNSKSAEFYCKMIFEPVKTLRFELSFLARTRQQWSVEKWLNGDYSLSASVQKSFFKNRLLATFIYAGILYCDGIFTTRMSDGSYFATSREVSSPRHWWAISLSYRFNHKATKAIPTVSTLQNVESVLN